ncbi:MAG TPA: cyclic 2,3-diphosphoglycerate synthase [candidate division Zixibacteria bacterium]
MPKRKVIIMGAAGRDFHNFNTVHRHNRTYQVVAFTATQIPNIYGRKYPAKLAGKLYPKGIPIFPEEDLIKSIEKDKVDEVVFSYSDVSYDYVMHRAALVNSAGADFKLLGAKETMLESKVPVVAVCATRTGSGKSQTTRRVCQILKELGKKIVVVRHPMPYGDLAKQACQRFAQLSDLDKHNCTIEEREEYEPHIAQGNIVYAGVDYHLILKKAEKEAQVIVWDGGNNDTSFFKPDLYIVVADPHRPGDELHYYPGSTNLILADIVVINKVGTAKKEDVAQVRSNVGMVNPKAIIIEAESPIFVDNPALIKDKNVLVVEDGPTLTHGGMKYGAGVIAAQRYGAKTLIDPRPFAIGSIKEAFKKFPHMGSLLPAMGYGDGQIEELERTINSAKAEVVVIATPIDLRRVLKIEKPSVRVTYELQEISKPDLKDILTDFVMKLA